MAAQRFEVEVPGGTLVGTVTGVGPPVLLLHGGPGLNGDYLDELVPELSDAYRVAWYQQRGLDPSTAREPYDVAVQVADVGRVLDALGWETAVEQQQRRATADALSDQRAAGNLDLEPRHLHDGTLEAAPGRRRRVRGTGPRTLESCPCTASWGSRPSTASPCPGTRT